MREYNFKIFPVHEHKLGDTKQSERSSKIYCDCIALRHMQFFSTVAFVQCGKSVLSREKTLHRNARKANGEVYDAATSSVINKKCLNSYVNCLNSLFNLKFLLAPSVTSVIHHCIKLQFISESSDYFLNILSHTNKKLIYERKRI